MTLLLKRARKHRPPQSLFPKRQNPLLPTQTPWRRPTWWLPVQRMERHRRRRSRRWLQPHHSLKPTRKLHHLPQRRPQALGNFLLSARSVQLIRRWLMVAASARESRSEASLGLSLTPCVLVWSLCVAGCGQEWQLSRRLERPVQRTHPVADHEPHAAHPNRRAALPARGGGRHVGQRRHRGGEQAP